MPVVHDDGVPIRLWEWSETSQTAAVFTREHGVVRGLAKGSRRPKSPYSGGLELLTRGAVGLILKPTTDLALITEFDLLETFPAVRQHLRAYYGAMYAADLVHHLVLDRDPHPELYDALLTCLRGLGRREGRHPGPAAALAAFQFAACRLAGYRPVLDRYVTDGGAVPADQPVVSFNPELGGLVPDDAADLPGESWRLRAATLAALRALGGEDPAPPPTPTPTPTHPTPAPAPAPAPGARDAGEPGASAGTISPTERAARFLAAYLRYLLDQQLPTLPLVFPDLAAS